MTPSERADHKLRLFRKQRAGAIVLVPIGIAMFIIGLREYAHSRPQPGAQLVSGTVTQRAMVRQWGVVKRPELTIRINGSEDVVKARLFSDGRNAFREGPVNFYYSGDPTKEVFIQGETNPLWIATPFLIGPFVVLGIAHYAIRAVTSA